MNFNGIGYHIWEKYLEYRLQKLKTVWKFFFSIRIKQKLQNNKFK